MKRFAEEHLSVSCPRRKEKCTVCLKMVAHEDMPSHLDEICPKVEIECSNSSCSIKVFRGELKAHQNICPKQKIACLYSEAGCNAEILREDKQKHLLENVEHHGTVASATVLLLKRELSDVRKQLQSALETKSVPPVTFTITNYKHKKESNHYWQSSYFYTNVQGYKMSLEVDINSDDSDAKNHLSLYCRIASGVNDDSLAWPFPGEITVQILNQSRDLGHYTKTLDWNGADDTVTGKPSKGESKCCWGYPAFISHAELERESKGYLKNDCIYIQVLKVSFPKPWLAYSIIPSSEAS